MKEKIKAYKKVKTNAVGSLSVRNTKDEYLIAPKDYKGITLIALIITIILMIILVSVTVTIAINGGLFDTANEAKILTIIANIKEEIGVQKMEAMVENKDLTIESLLADGKIRRRVEEEIKDSTENYYLYYAIKDNAFNGMSGLGKGIDKDIFLIDDNLNVSYIDKKGREYGDIIAKKLLEDDTQIRFASKAFGEYVSKIGGTTEEKMLFKWMKNQTSLTINDQNIDSLEDLVFFPNLTNLSLTISVDKLQNLSGIENCQKLKNLSLWGSGSKENYGTMDFSAMSGLQNLTSFNTSKAGILSDRNWGNLIDSLKQINTLTSLGCGSGRSISRINFNKRCRRIKEFAKFNY